jgi:hypothetical protein
MPEMLDEHAEGIGAGLLLIARASKAPAVQ